MLKPRAQLLQRKSPGLGKCYHFEAERRTTRYTSIYEPCIFEPLRPRAADHRLALPESI